MSVQLVTVRTGPDTTKMFLLKRDLLRLPQRSLATGSTQETIIAAIEGVIAMDKLDSASMRRSAQARA